MVPAHFVSLDATDAHTPFTRQKAELEWQLQFHTTKTSRIYLACSPYLEMKGQRQFETLCSGHLLYQCFSFCGLCAGEPWEKCIIPFTSFLSHHKQDPCCRESNIWQPPWWLWNRDWQTRQGLSHHCSFSELSQLNCTNVNCSQFSRSPTCCSHKSDHC